MSDALTSFRAALRPLHDRIERTVDLIRDDVDHGRYDRFLARSYGFIASCEERLDHSGAPETLRLSERLKSESLAGDLRHRGIDPSSLPRPARIPAVDRWPHALGYLYVIEGSTLGSQLINRHLSGRLGLGHDVTSFLRGYGPATGSRWREFLAVLAPCLSASDADHQSITSAAAETFSLLERFHALE